MSEGGGRAAETTGDESDRGPPRGYFQPLADAIDDGIAVVDGEGELTYVNERAEEILGRSRDGLSALSADDSRLDLIGESGEPLETDDHPFERVLEHGERVRDRIVGLRRPDDERVWLSVNGSPERAGGDGAVFVFETVTERRGVAGEPEEILGRVSDAFYALDDEFRFTHVNERAEQLLEASADELLGESLWEQFPEAEAIDDVRRAFRTASETQEAKRYEVYYDPLDFWVESTVYPSETGVSVYFRDVTERRERERYLADAKAQLEAATEAGAVGTWEWHVSEDEFVTGASFARTFGIDPAAARDGLPLARITSSIHEDDREQVTDAIETALETGGEYEEEYRVWDDDDELRWVVARGHVECDDAGEPVRFPGTITDITERKRAELALEKQTRELETLFQVLPVGVVVANADGSLRRANDTAQEIWGGDVFDSESVDEYEKFTATRAESDESVGPRDWTMYQVLQGETVTDPNVFEIEAFDGERRIVMEHGKPVLDGDGDVSRAVVTLTDITERREYERALEEHRRQLSTLMANVPGVVYRCENERGWPMEFVSDACRDLTGYDPEALESGEVSYGEDIVVEDDREEVWEAVQGMSDERETFSVTYRIRTADGDVRWVRSYGRGVFADGDLVALEGIISDVTERKRLETALKESNERLEQFAYAASHDLQEPLRMVTSYLQLLEGRYADAFDDDGEEFLRFAVDGARRMREMIDALLQYSRIDTQGAPFETVDLNAVLEDVREDLQMRIEETDADVTVGDLPRVQGDPSQLRQVFQNLLENAIQYRGDGSPRIDVRAEREGAEWVLSVRDEGIGIDPADADRIFEVFQRLHSHEEQSGTGIGLALCRRIVDRHGGEIRVESTPGEGTTFVVTLPADH